MSKIQSSARFKSYQPQRMLLLPPSFDELIEEHDLVRVVNRIVDSLEIIGLINQYKGGGNNSLSSTNVIEDTVVCLQCEDIHRPKDS